LFICVNNEIIIVIIIINKLINESIEEEIGYEKVEETVKNKKRIITETHTTRFQ